MKSSELWYLMNNMNTKNGLLFLLPWIITLAVGTYLISTTHLITKDGPHYIQQAQQFAVNPVGAIKSDYFGYPFLIYAAHRIAAVFVAADSVNSWILSAQLVTLLCMFAAFVPLYFIGKGFLGSDRSFYALLILAFLPYPVRFAGDVLRDWPYILFLSLGFAALIAAAKGKNWWLYGVTGFLAGLGYFIKVECAQLVIYGLLWLAFCIISPRYRTARKKNLLSVLLLLVCFAVVVLPYMHIKQQFIPEKIKELMDESSSVANTAVILAAGPAAGLIDSIIKIVERTGENLFYYFFVFSLIGFYTQFIKGFKKATDVEKVFVTSFILFNVLMLAWLFHNFNYLSRRHCLPLSLLFLFYSPIGLKIVGEKISSIFKVNPTFWFYMLLVLGILLCLPKLLEPKHKDRDGFLDAAGWLAHNTSPGDLIAVPDERIIFYSQRQGFQAWEKKDLKNAVFAVVQVGAKDSAPGWGQEMVWFWVNPEKKDSKLIIYRLP
jgi:4-amino-4-deoxy-L-arabinose transferase-like glycosyltransferase